MPLKSRTTAAARALLLREDFQQGIEIALCYELGQLPEPVFTHGFCCGSRKQSLGWSRSSGVTTPEATRSFLWPAGLELNIRQKPGI